MESDSDSFFVSQSDVLINNVYALVAMPERELFICFVERNCLPNKTAVIITLNLPSLRFGNLFFIVGLLVLIVYCIEVRFAYIVQKCRNSQRLNRRIVPFEDFAPQLTALFERVDSRYLIKSSIPSRFVSRNAISKISLFVISALCLKSVKKSLIHNSFQILHTLYRSLCFLSIIIPVFTITTGVEYG